MKTLVSLKFDKFGVCVHTNSSFRKLEFNLSWVKFWYNVQNEGIYNFEKNPLLMEFWFAVLDGLELYKARV